MKGYFLAMHNRTPSPFLIAFLIGAIVDTSVIIWRQHQCNGVACLASLKPLEWRVFEVLFVVNGTETKWQAFFSLRGLLCFFANANICRPRDLDKPPRGTRFCVFVRVVKRLLCTCFLSQHKEWTPSVQTVVELRCVSSDPTSPIETEVLVGKFLR